MVDDAAFNRLVEQLEDAGELLKADTRPLAETAELDAQAIRQAIGATRRSFATMLNVPLETVEQWEDGSLQPAGAERALLRILQSDPEIIVTLLQKISAGH